jgi:hypothetical protein
LGERLFRAEGLLAELRERRAEGPPREQPEEAIPCEPQLESTLNSLMALEASL